MELREALAQISEIRLQLARTEVFRGYRALPVAFSGTLAVVAALAQPVLVPDPAANVHHYLALWLTAAALAVAAAGAELAYRYQWARTLLRRELTWLAVEQFLPCLVAGALVTAVLVFHAPQHAELLPGLWLTMYSLGIFASWRLLPKAIFGVGLWYLLAGVLVLTEARGAAAFAPWAMGLPFAVGQLAAAAILYWTLERPAGHGELDDAA